jgi:hypothetical protein
VRDGGDDEVGATGTMAPRGRRARDDTKRTELPRGNFRSPRRFIGRLDRKTSVVVDRGFRGGRKAIRAFHRLALFRKTEREKKPRRNSILLLSVVGESLTLIQGSGKAAAARDIISETVTQIRIPNDLGARDRDVRDVTSNGARLTTTRPST